MAFQGTEIDCGPHKNSLNDQTVKSSLLFNFHLILSLLSLVRYENLVDGKMKLLSISQSLKFLIGLEVMAFKK